MADRVEVVCYICEKRHICKSAVSWCTICPGPLCDECAIYHGLSKSSEYHETISIDNYFKLPEFARDISLQCTDHDGNMFLFCEDHGIPCCVKCVRDNHSACRRLAPFKEIADNVKSSTYVDDIDINLDDIVQNIDEILKDRKDNVQNLNKQYESYKQNINDFRNEVIVQLDYIAKNIVTTLKDKIEECNSKTLSLIDELQEKKAHILQLKSDLLQLKTLASGVQLYFASKILEQKIAEGIIYLQELFQSGNLDTLSLKYFPVSSIVEKFTQNISNLKNATISRNSYTKNIIIRKQRQAQITSISELKRTNIEDLQLNLTRDFCLPSFLFRLEPEITDCEILSDGNMAFTDYNNRNIILLNSNGSFSKTFNFSSRPIGLTECSKDILAVSFQDNNEVVLIDISSGKQLQKIEFDEACLGIASWNDKLYIRIWSFGCHVYDLSCNPLTTIPVIGRYMPHLSVFQNKIYCAKWDINKVFCADIDGKIVWEFQCADLQEPWGVTNDNSGNVFVVGKSSNNVFIISPDGKNYKLLLNENNATRNSRAIHFCRTTKRLLVGNAQSFHLYNVSGKA